MNVILCIHIIPYIFINEIVCVLLDFFLKTKKKKKKNLCMKGFENMLQVDVVLGF